MKDFRLEERINNYRKCSFDMMSVLENSHLSLRKKQVDNFIYHSRMKDWKKSDHVLEIDIDALEVDYQYKNFSIIDIAENLNEVISFVKSDNLEYVKLGVNVLRKYLAKSVQDKDTYKINERKDLIDKLIEILKNSLDYNLIFEIYWVFTNLSMVKNFTENFNFTEYLEICHYYFNSKYEDIIELIIWSISHMISENEIFKEIIFKSDFINDIIKLCKKENSSCSIVRMYSWFFVSLFKIQNYIPDFKIIKEIINICVNLVYIKDNEIVINGIWVLSYLSEYKYPNIEEFILNSGAIVKILSIVPTFNAIQLPIVTLFGNILICKKVLEFLCEQNILGHLYQIYNNTQNKYIHRQILWGISNIAADEYNYLVKIMDSQFIDIITNSLSEYEDLSIKRECLYIIKNLLSDRHIEISLGLIHKRVIEKVYNLIELENDSEILSLSLVIIYNFYHAGKNLLETMKQDSILSYLEKSDIPSLVYNMTNNDSNKVKLMAECIIKEFLENNNN